MKRYTIRRLSLASVIRLGCVLGALIAFPPALCLASLALQVLGGLQRVFAGVAPISISFFGLELARIDLLAALTLRQTADAVTALVESASSTFLILAAILTLAGVLFALISALVAGLAYNLLARYGFGLSFDLAEQPGLVPAEEEHTAGTV